MDLGLLDGIPVKTFTHYPRYENSTLPSIEYLDIIKSGIKDTYSEMAESDIDAYIMASYLGDDEIEILKFLRSQPHGVTIERICNELNKIAKKVIDTVSNLLELHLIKQDRRSIEDGILWDSLDAIYYTVKNRRVAIDKVLDCIEIIESNIKDL